MNANITYRGRTVTNPFARYAIMFFLLMWTVCVTVPLAIVFTVVGVVVSVVTGRVRITRKN